MPKFRKDLEPYHGRVMKVKCGTRGHHVGYTYVTPMWPFVVMIQHTNRAAAQSRPDMTFEEPDELTYVEGGRFRLFCRPKCNRGHPRRYVFDYRRAASAFAAAARAGRRELALGETL